MANQSEISDKENTFVLSKKSTSQDLSKNDKFNFNSRDNNKNKLNSSLRSSFGEIKFIFHSIIPEFKHNYSGNSFDQSLEFKPIYRGKSDGDVLRKFQKYFINSKNSELLCENSVINNNLNENSKDSDNGDRKIFYLGDFDSSTPVKRTSSSRSHSQQSLNLNNDNNDNVKQKLKLDLSEMKSTCENNEIYKLNLLTPPADAVFIDSDFESMDHDHNSENEITINLNINKKLNESNIVINEKSKLSRNRRILNAIASPLMSRRKKNQDDNLDKKSSVISFPLTKINLIKFSNDNYENDKLFNLQNSFIEWGDNFDFSFICEPSTSDCEDDSFTQFDTNLNTIVHSQIIPTFKIDPPPPPINQPIYENSIYCNGFRRSLSDPSYSNFTPNSSSPPSDIDESDIETHSVMESALIPEINKINCASIKTLETISVSNLYIHKAG